MKKEIIVQVHTADGGCFIPKLFDAVDGWQEKAQEYINEKRKLMKCSKVVLRVNCTNKSRTIHLGEEG